MKKNSVLDYIDIGKEWMAKNHWSPLPFQTKTWKAYLDGYSGILNAPTGSGKTLALFVPLYLEYIRACSELAHAADSPKGIQALWITPIKALAKEIQFSGRNAAKGLGVDWRIEIRTGDTSSSDRKRQAENPPEVLITTPESLHLILATKGHHQLLSGLKVLVADEWHELMGSKRGVQLELAISRLLGLSGNLKIWGISATIENLEQASDVLLGIRKESMKWVIIKSRQVKRIAVESIIPDEIEKYPWSGHLGIRMLHRIIPIVRKSKSTLIFTNTRSQCEIWYQKILSASPNLAGLIAMHHGSMSRELRDWVEEAIHEERLKAVVCTSSLDLGVDFRPVETIIQIGSPKGVSRFVQRAGRSGHNPGAISKIYFVPTHSLELIEGAALRTAIAEGIQEPRIPYIRSFDVLLQYLMTLAISGGFEPNQTYLEVKSCFCFQSMSIEEWDWILDFLIFGGSSLQVYNEYRKLTREGKGYTVANKHIARRHRLSMGTIVGDLALTVKFKNGKKLGTIEEWFLSRIKPGDVIWFAGRPLELVRISGMDAIVKKTRKRAGKIPSWQGGRMPLSSMLSKMIRKKMVHYTQGVIDEMELEKLSPLFEQQRAESYLPGEGEFLIEYFQSKEGFHLCMYPFEGRFVHEGIAALIAKRISNELAISFSIAMNDYGFELLSTREIEIKTMLDKKWFDTKNLILDIQASINSVEMARRRFRDIAKISGLIFQGYPGKTKKDKHLQSSSSLLFDVFKDYDPENLLYQQTFEEVMTFQLEEERLRQALKRISNQKIVLSQPKGFTPFSFPIIVDRLSRDRLSSEKIEVQVKNMIAQSKGSSKK